MHGLAHRFFDPLLAQLRLLLAPRDLYGPVKATMLADGYAVAAGLVVAAVLANHVRRVLVPWLGQFLWWHPVQDMKLARAAPHYFVEEQLLRSAATDAAALGFWALQTCALAVARALLRHRCLLADGAAITCTSTDAKGRGSQRAGFDGGDGGGGRGGGTGPRAAAKRTAAATAAATATASSACLTDGCRILYLCLCLMQVEYAYAEACWAASWMHASAQLLLRGSTAERLFTHRLLTGDWHLVRADYPDSSAQGHRRGMLLIVGLLLWWLWRAVQPLRRHGVVGVALSGLPLLGGLVGIGTAHIIRYSNKYFIWLEMSEMLLTWAWLVLGFALVGTWRLCDDKSPK